MGLKEILTMIEGLTDDEKQQVKKALSETADTPAVAEPTAEKEAETIAEGKQVSEEPSHVNDSEAIEPSGNSDKEISDDKAVKETIEATTDEAIPLMSKTEPATDSEKLPEKAAPTEDEQGEDLPVDYQQIIDGLNAKILALQTENGKLKAKTEGAFGLSLKPGEFTKVNPLYDDDTSDIHFKK